jgi:hypothetical protein
LLHFSVYETAPFVRVVYGRTPEHLRDICLTGTEGSRWQQSRPISGQGCFQLYLLIKNRSDLYAAAVEEIMLGVAQSAFFVAQELQGKVMKQMLSGSAIAFLSNIVLYY